ncbi:beta-carotene 15,15'-monooxygenase [Chryseobacterium sp. SNU WT5]|uniref:beta-carotene 15,15'-monooxygenase n=1 Tax=Chryseobacterium sp. SNU WT5 TaxID=2594269 RepID=UPI00117EDE81|nr:beta-carotene 15,15'-monooxygenase [Chryseobacterium sp. SNU WT5]QDP85417.1 beta-carotene 15,15'-monooxygenase [Chryseobacterium sp. SNU WT5]
MDTFQEFDQPTGPEKSTGAIISHAFEMYKGVFMYAVAAVILAVVISFVVSLIIQPISGVNSNDMLEELKSSPETFSTNMWSIPGIRTYYGLSGLVSLLLTPIYVGIIYMANKYNLKEPMSFSDLFIGFRQNFVNIIIYTLISSIILGIAFTLCVIPGFFVLPFFMLGYPILLFENASFSEAISKSFSIAKNNYGTFLGASLLGFLISIAGIFLCGIGLVFTMLFLMIVMYSLYCAYCGRPRPIVVNK